MLTLALSLMSIMTVQKAPAAAIPDIKLRVAVQQKESGNLNQGIHILTLECLSGECWLTSVSLNQCRDNPLGTPSFPVVVEFSSTRDGRLAVSNSGAVLKVEEVSSDIRGQIRSTFLFGYEFTGSIATVTSFSGGFVKDSVIANRILTAEYVPFKRLVQGFPLDCQVLLPGVNGSDRDDLIASLSEEDWIAWEKAKVDPDQPSKNVVKIAAGAVPGFEEIMASEDPQLTDDQRENFLAAYLKQSDLWLKRHGMSAASRAEFLKVFSKELHEPQRGQDQ